MPPEPEPKPEKDAAPGIPELAVPAKPDTREPAAPARVLSIHAHPDDQEFTVGGTLAKWARLGSHVVTVCITSGGAGSNEHTPPDMTRDALVPIREEEQRQACRVLGISEVVFLGYEDGMLESTLALRRELTRVIRRHRPDAVVCGDPTVRYYGSMYMNHPDHRAASDAALDAVFPSAETRLIFPELLAEGLEPHKVGAVFIHGSDTPDTFIDISERPHGQARRPQGAPHPDGHVGSDRDDHRSGRASRAPRGSWRRRSPSGVMRLHDA